MSIKIHANRVLGTIHVTKFLGVFKGAQIKSGPRAPTDLNAALVDRLYPPRSVRLSNNKVSSGLEDKKLTKKLSFRVPKFFRQIKKLLVLGADPTFLKKNTCELTSGV